MKSIQNQYIDLKEGRMSQENFMRNLRMTLPQYITNVTSFNDSVRILKNKGILTEDLVGQQMAGNPNAEAGMRKAFRSPAFEEGKKAAFAGVEMEANPYNPDSKEGQEWIEGWVHGGENMIPDENPFDDVIDTDGEINEEEQEYDFQIGEEINTPEGRGVVVDSDGFNYVIDLNDGGTVRFDGDALQAANRPALEEIKKAKLHPNQVNPHELYIGTKVELEHTDDIDEAQTIALQHLEENPFYYTALKMSGVESNNSLNKKLNPKKKEEKKKDDKVMVDKANQMKTPKGVEKVKASAAKAKKETNKPVKGISFMSLVAKSTRGVKKMEPTGEKMKKVKIKEGLYGTDNSREVSKDEFLNIIKSDPVIKDWARDGKLQAARDVAKNSYILTWEEGNNEIKDHILSILHMDLEENNSFDWNNITKEEAYKLFDYHENSGQLPDGLDYKKFKQIMDKFSINRDDDEDFIDPAGGHGLHSHIEETKVKNNIKKLIYEILNESMDLESAKAEAQQISEKEGVVQHVNELPNGSYSVSDWYDSDTTVCSYEGGIKLN